VLGSIRNHLSYRVAQAGYLLLSERARLRARRQRTVVQAEAPYAGQKIVLLALYEKGLLRPDIVRLLQMAREAGHYVLAVNTLRLADPATVAGLIDCYIERPNFGRDFGSYRTGFMHLFARGWERDCPRLLMLNDSVYYNEERLAAFLADMMGSDIEALGSTENFEIEHHLGSFCIAMGAPVLRHALFRRFWRNYRLSDVRPAVIRRGEMGLTRALKRCVSSPEQFGALYGAARFSQAVSTDDGLLDFAVRNTRRSDLVHWRRATPATLAEYVTDRFTLDRNDLENRNVTLELQNRPADARSWVTNVTEVEGHLRDKLSDPSVFDPKVLRKAIAGLVAEIFMVGSQIHQNGVVLLRMGLPLVKLDVLYRGVFNVEDMNLACEQMSPRDGAELRQLLVTRPYGGHMLFGWKRAAFERGLI